jgi:hypothetical protein
MMQKINSPSGSLGVTLSMFSHNMANAEPKLSMVMNSLAAAVSA